MEAARRLMIEKQGIFKPHGRGKEAVYDAVDRLGCLQIDTINVVERSHYLTLWTRLGCHDKSHLDELAYSDRRLFEHWAHAASYIPFKDYRFYLESMEQRKVETQARWKKRTGEDPALIDHVLNRVKEEGPLASKDFDGPKRRGGWWNWKPAKYAMELLFGAGVLLVSHRNNFQRFYDLAENVIPGDVDTVKPGEEERARFFTLKTLNCLGLTSPVEVKQYYQPSAIKLKESTQAITDRLDALTSEGLAEKHTLESSKTPCYLLPEDSARLQELPGDIDTEEVRLLGYFDNLMWNRGRVDRLFGFKPKLEIYLPREQRVYGYYHMPVLYGDRLVARLEPKMDRKNQTLIVRGYWLEEGFKPTEDYADRLTACLDDFAQFHGATQINWELDDGGA